MAISHIQEHVDLIARHEQEFLARRTHTERLGDHIARFVGSIQFVAAHLAVFAAWILWNALPRTRHFDPAPFSLLSTIVGLEAILLASFILMRQARLSRRSDEREHLMLQILLLTEKEVTAVLSMDRKIAGQVGLDKAANTAEIRELSQHTSIEDVAQTIKQSITADNVSAGGGPAAQAKPDGDPLRGAVLVFAYADEAFARSPDEAFARSPEGAGAFRPLNRATPNPPFRAGPFGRRGENSPGLKPLCSR